MADWTKVQSAWHPARAADGLPIPRRQRWNDQSEHPLRATDAQLEQDRVLRVARSVELHICPECASDLVYPLDWAPVDAVHWRVALRCPECEWRSSASTSRRVLDRFDQVLDAGTRLAPRRSAQARALQHGGRAASASTSRSAAT